MRVVVEGEGAWEFPDDATDGEVAVAINREKGLGPRGVPEFRGQGPGYEARTTGPGPIGALLGRSAAPPLPPAAPAPAGMAPPPGGTAPRPGSFAPEVMKPENPLRQALLAKRQAARGAPLGSLGPEAVQAAGAAAAPPMPDVPLPGLAPVLDPLKAFGMEAARATPGAVASLARFVPDMQRNLIQGAQGMAADAANLSPQERRAAQIATEAIVGAAGMIIPALAPAAFASQGDVLEEKVARPLEALLGGTGISKKLDEKRKRLSTGEKLKDPEMWGAATGAAVPSLAAMAAAKALGAPLLPVTAAMEGGATLRDIERFEEEIGKKIHPLRKFATAGIVGVVNGTLEKFGFERGILRLSALLPKPARKGFVRAATQAVQGGIGEGGTEMTQEVVSNVVSGLLVDPSREWNEGLTEAGMGGFGAGFFLGGGAGAKRSSDVQDRAKRMKAREQWRGEEATWSLDAEDGGAPVAPERAEKVTGWQERNMAPPPGPTSPDEDLERFRAGSAGLDAQLRSLQSQEGQDTAEGIPPQPYEWRMDEDLTRLEAEAGELDRRIEALRRGEVPPPPAPPERAEAAQPPHLPISVDTLLGAQALPAVVGETRLRDQTAEVRGRSVRRAAENEERQRIANTPGEALRLILGDEPAFRPEPPRPAPEGHQSAALDAVIERGSSGDETLETPEETDRAFLSGLGLTPEQAREVGARMPTADEVTGYATARHHGPALERAQEWAERTGQPAQYVEIDIHNLGGMNAALGHSRADRVIRQIAETVRAEFPEEKGKRVSFIRHGGDELSLVTAGYAEEDVAERMARAEEAVSGVVRAAGLGDIPHAKGATDEAGRDRRRGAGIFWGTAPIEPGVSLSRTREVADFAVEARKFTRRVEDVDRKQAVPSRNPSGPRPGGDAAEDPGGRARRQGSAPEDARGERSPAEANRRGIPARLPRGGDPEGVADRTAADTQSARGREAFRRRFGEDAAGVDRFLSLADAVSQEAHDASPEEVHEAASALFEEERRLERAAPRGAEVDAGAGTPDTRDARGRRAPAEGTRREARAPNGATAPRSVARSFSRPPDPGSHGISLRDLSAAVARVEGAWPAAPEIAVIRNETELPLEVQEAIGTEKVRGVYHGGRHDTPGSGTVFLLADRVGSLAEAFETLAHEIVGHAGTVSVLGPRGWKVFVGEFLESREGRGLVAEWEAERGGEYDFDLTTPKGREGAVGETVAWLAERKVANPEWKAPSLYQRLAARIRMALRGLARAFGVSPKAIQWSEADVDALLARAARHFEGPRKEGTVGTWLSRQPEDGGRDQEPALTEAQRRRVEELVSRTRARLAEVDPRWRQLAEDLARVPQAPSGSEEGPPANPDSPPPAEVRTSSDTPTREEARPDLANPGTEPSGRRLVDAVDRARNEEQEPLRRADAEVNAEADRRLEEDWERERRALISRGRQGAGLNDVETVTAKKIVSAEAFAAMKAGDVEALAETAELIDAYRRTGTEQARAFRQRRDEVMSPRERLAAFVAEALLRPGDAATETIRTGTPSQRRETLRRHGAQAKAVLERLRRRGVDVASLTDEDLSDRFLVARVVHEVAAARADLSDKVFEYWANSILSGPLTHIANLTGNTVSLFIEYGFQQPLEMALGSAAGGTRTLAEGRALYGALWRGVVRGSRNAVEAFRTEQRALGEAGDPLSLDRLEARVAIGGRAGRMVRIPYRFLRAADEFYRGLIGEMEAAATAHGMARKEGLSGEAFEARTRELLEDGESAAWQAASDRADLLTFQRELRRFGRLILSVRRQVPGLRYILPFVTTPTNIFTTALQKSPAGAVGSLWRASRGELSKDDAIRSGAEQLIGLGVVALLAQGVGGGEDDEEPWITGTVPFRGSRKGERDLAERTAPPLSVRVDGKWYRYGRLEPLATWLGFTVDGLRGVKEARAGKELDAVLASTLKRFVGQFEDKTFLDGLGRVIRAIDDGKSALRVVGDVASGFIPAALRQPAQATEGKVRETRAWGAGPSPKHEGERYERRLARRIAERAAPFAFEGTPKVNAYGLEVEKLNRSFLGRLLSPVQRLDPETLPADVRRIDAAFVLWNKRHPDAPFYPSIPEPRYTLQGRTHYFTDDEYRQLLLRAGVIARKDLKGLVERTDGVLSEGDIERARSTFRKAAKAARESMKGKNAAGVEDREERSR